MALSHLNLNAWEKAMQILKEICEKEPNNKQAKDKMDEIKNNVKKELSKPPSVKKNKGLNLSFSKEVIETE